MTGSFDTIDKLAEPKPSATNEESFELSSVVVEYDGKPNRCTIYPNEATRLQRMASWITADADTFVPLDKMC
ncbi:hypothetical protein SAMN05421858_2696 [Haladaptatus litoreus]|uniref:DUF7511 domain-containing protein n=1 Tax=Haladaptatus litoreus TaxID=553468 RepID=A0A1N7BQH8_9EURY|nr:hypothetical protein [Haladaptatus litoreus]SIR53575.1 hypothetical protein SAMN05421858_2696 [Haladaptatus litoreus]